MHFHRNSVTLKYRYCIQCSRLSINQRSCVMFLKYYMNTLCQPKQREKKTFSVYLHIDKSKAQCPNHYLGSTKNANS